MPKAYLLFNPVAGRVRSLRLVERAARVLRDAGWELKLAQSRSGLHTTEIAREAAEAGYDAVFVAGGDGSVGHTVAGLVSSQTAMGVLPAGTSNVWAQELGLQKQTWFHLRALEKTARSLAAASLRAVDVGLCNEHSFLLWAGVGLDGVIIDQLERGRRRSRWFPVTQYLATLLKSAYSWRGMRLEIQVDEKQFNGHYYLVVISNIRYYAGGLAKLSPQACIDDGVMDLWLFSGDHLRQVLSHAQKLFRGKHVQSEHIECIPFRHLRMHSDSPLYLQLDGDPVGVDRELTVEVRHRGLNVLVPPEASGELFCQPPMPVAEKAGS